MNTGTPFSLVLGDPTRNAFGDALYIVYSQTPGEADALLAQDVERTIRYFMRRPASSVSPVEARAPERRSLALQEGLKRYDPAGDSAQFLSLEEIGVFVEAFQRTGFTGPVNWYRNFTRNWERSEALPVRLDNLPCLMVMAEKDAVLAPALADRMGDQISDLEKVLIEDCGHWTQQEKPHELNQILIDWLDRRFPVRKSDRP